MRSHNDLPLPDWPILMDLATAAAYLTMSEASFRRVVARERVVPVETGTSLLRWRRPDLDRLIEQLPAREPGCPRTDTDIGLAAEALERVRNRRSRS